MKQIGKKVEFKNNKALANLTKSLLNNVIRGNKFMRFSNDSRNVIN